MKFEQLVVDDEWMMKLNPSTLSLVLATLQAMKSEGRVIRKAELQGWYAQQPTNLGSEWHSGGDT
jgi:hypothetical protein